jgi:hypothetical protein
VARAPEAPRSLIEDDRPRSIWPSVSPARRHPDAHGGQDQGHLIYRRTGNPRAVQLLLGHTTIESTVRYLGIEVDEALAVAEQVDV